MLKKILLWSLLGVLLLMGSGWLLADWLQPRAVGAPSDALPVREGETVLDRAIAPLLAAHPGDSGVALLADGLDAFAVRAASTEAAGRSLDIQTYIWRDDLSGQLLAREIWRAAQRGVRVRLLFDDLTLRGTDRKLLALAAHEHIQIRIYNPLRNRGGVLRVIEMLQRSWSLNYRMHNKAWIADGRVAIAGGRNVGAEYFLASTQTNFHDLDVVMVGPVVAQASVIFDAFWNSEAVVPIEALARRARIDLPAFLAGVDRQAGEESARAYLQRVADATDVGAWFRGEARVYWSDRMRLVSDPPIKRDRPIDDTWLVRQLAAQLGTTRREALLISPYFVPGDEFTQWLGERVGAGAKVGVVTNSLAATDVLAVHSGYARYRQPLLAAGVVLHELRQRPGEGGSSLFGSSGASLHTKAYVLDGERGFIGSFNLDPRSAWLNTEMGLLFEDAGLAQAVRDEYRHLAQPSMSYAVRLNAQGEVRWHDASVDPPRILDREPESTRWQRAAARVLGWLPLESQL